MLYAGYVGLSASFSYAAAALMVGEEGWARAARPFMLIAWIALTCGIALGSWWAYYELGWGGFWFWDPVENASLMPWLVATALLHSALATEKKRRLPHLDLAAGDRRLFHEPDRHLPGALRRAVVGACLCHRSHPRLFHHGADRSAPSAARWRCSPGGRRPCRAAPPSTRSAAKPRCCSTMSSWWRPAPRCLSARSIRWCWTRMGGDKISVGPPYYAATFAPIFFALLLLVPLGPRLGWRRGDLKAALRALAPALGLAALAALAVLMIASPALPDRRAGLCRGGLADRRQHHRCSAAQGRARQRLCRGAGPCRTGRHLDGRGRHDLVAQRSAGGGGSGRYHEGGPYTLRFDGVTAVQGPTISASRAHIALMDGARVQA